jgi:hypothetical protein
VRLFTEARDAALHCDAYLVDTARLARPFVLEGARGREAVIDELLGRVVLMGRSLYAVRERTFALFCGDGKDLVVAPTEPFHEDVLAVLRDALAGFGAVRVEADLRLDRSGLFPLVAYERGRVSFFDSRETRAFVPLAGRRGLRILAATCAHAPAPHVLVGDVPAPAYVEEVAP